MVIAATPTISAGPPLAAATVDATSEAERVQHVNKVSSDQLLSKFAAMDSDSDTENAASAKKEAKRSRRRSSGNRKIAEGKENCNENMNSSLIEVNSVLLPSSGTRRSASFLKQLGIRRSKQRSRDLRNRPVLGTLEKTWSKAVRGASRVFIEKHYHRHRRLISDPVTAV